MTTRAAILVEQGKPLIIDEINMPETLAVGQVRVRVHCSGICGSQLGEIDGIKGPDPYLPHLMGHEGFATVEETGPGVRHVATDDTVVMHWRPGLGIDAEPARYGWDDKTVSAGKVTTFNERAVVSENRLTRIDPETEKDIAALYGCAVTTGFGVVQNDAKLQVGESVVVFGAGGIGLSIVQAAHMVTADPIVAVDLHDNRLDLARKMGATHTVNAANGDVRQAMNDVLDGRPLNVFVDNTGRSDIIEMGYNMIGESGRVVLVGVPDHADRASIDTLPLHFGKSMIGSHGGDAQPHLDIPRFHRLYRQGRLDLKSLVTETFALDEINDAIAGMRDGRIAGRCIIDLDES